MSKVRQAEMICVAMRLLLCGSTADKASLFFTDVASLTQFLCWDQYELPKYQTCYAKPIGSSTKSSRFFANNICQVWKRLFFKNNVAIQFTANDR